MILKKFLKYFDKMTELHIIEFNDFSDNGKTLFKGYTFDKGAGKKLKKLYKQGYKLQLNRDGEAVMIFTHINEHGVALALAQINVYLPKGV